MGLAHKQEYVSAAAQPALAGASAVRWTSSARTDPGAEREINEDAYIERPDIGLWAVADGMGGHARGEVASAMLVDSLRQVAAPTSLSSFVDEVEDHLLAANHQLRAYAAERGLKTIGATVAALLIFQRHAVCLWAGDSRIYRYRNECLERLTHDHALVEDLVRMGIVNRSEAENHPHANLITRAVGAADRLCLDIDVCDAQAGDIFMLCSDGLSREVPEKAIAGTLRKHGMRGASGALVDLALSHRARDNVTAITVRLLEPATPSPPTN